MKQKISSFEVMKYFFKKMFELKWYFYLTIIGVTIVTLTSLTIPLYFKGIIDIISTSGLDKEIILSEVNRYFIYFVLTTFVAILTWRWLDYTLQMGDNKIDCNISMECFKYIHKHSYDFFINNFAGAINKKVGRLIGAVQGLFEIFSREIIRFLISFIFIVVVLSKQNIYLGLGFFIYILIFIILSLVLNKFRVPYVERASSYNSGISGAYADAIVNNYNISIFGNFQKETKNMIELLKNWTKLERKSTFVYILVFAILSTISFSGEVLLLYFSIKLWSLGAISVGTFVLILTYQIMLSNQIFALSFMFGRISSHIGNSLEMLDILRTPHEIKDSENAKNLEVSKGKIEFKNVLFNYNKDVEVFKDFNLTINSGEKVGIVGASGSGKSSLIKLLFRFYDLKGGNIFIDGQDISKVTQDSLRSQISIVPQDTILFHRSLKENIGYSKENPTDEEIISASKKANCYDFISKLKNGYDTLVGERGVKLSGGERQRVSIARAMLQNNKILVLDEATSALDSESEKLIQNALENLMKDKTMIVIAHRLSTIMKMDRIVVMENGKIIEDGTHKELLEKSGVYKKLWDIQSGGFIGE